MPVTVPALGDTVPLFLFKPNWAQPYTESLEWKTDVQRAYSGVEQRRAMRIAPRRTLEYGISALDATESAAFENALYGTFDKLVAVPVWHTCVSLTAPAAVSDGTLTVSDTSYARLDSGIALLLYASRTQWEIVQPFAIGSTTITLTDILAAGWPAGTKIYPLAVGKLQDNVGVSRLTGTVLQASVMLTVDPVSSPVVLPTTPAAATTYNGYEVMLTQPNWASALNNDFSAAFSTVDSGTGAISWFTAEEFPRIARRYSWTLNGSEEASAFLAFLGRRIGMAKPFYVPTWHRDFKVVAASGSPTQAYLDVTENGFEAFVGLDVTRDRLLVRMANGDTYFRRITAVADQGGGVTRITLDTTLGVSFTVADFKDIHLLQLCRFATDKVNLSWLTSTVATVETTLITVKE